MEFADFTDINADLQQRLSSWRSMPDVVQNRRDAGGEPGVNGIELRLRQSHIGTMCLSVLKQHATFYAELEDFVHSQEKRSQHMQQRIEGMSAFRFGVFEQASALLLERSIQQEANSLPKEIIQTVYVQPPAPPRSWLQRTLGI
jgi:hypothetical protein